MINKIFYFVLQVIYKVMSTPTSTLQPTEPADESM
jgi:hypothetical protein